ncbi:MAG TPA: sigma-70 family RNA polymerase sigma factor [Planctomycetota bacterium]|nr:sigma-70 family RNA polymerase sigma factor [Planctomycetota bacterium]
MLPSPVRSASSTAPDPDAADLSDLRSGGTRAADALAGIVARHHARVRASAERVLGRRSAWLDDVCQATFLLLDRRRDGVRDGASLGAWLAAAARRIAANLRRAEDRRRRRERDASDARTTTRPEAIDARVERLPHALEALSAAQREALLRHVVAGERQAVIADALGVSEGAVKKRIADAKAALRAFFAAAGALLIAFMSGCRRAPRAVRWSVPTAGAVALAALVASVLRDDAAAPATTALPPAEAQAVADAVLAPIRALRRDDLAGLLAALPDGSAARIQGRWERFAAMPAPESDALADAGLAAVRLGWWDLDLQRRFYRPLTIDLVDGLGMAAQTGAELGERDLAALLRRLRDGMADHAAAIDPHDPAVVDAVARRTLATADVWPIASVAELRAMPFPEVVDVFASILPTMKDWYRPYGLDADRLLDSFVVESVRADGDRRVASVRFAAFGEQRLDLVVERCSDGSWRCASLEQALDLAFMRLRAYFWIDPALLPPVPEPDVIAPDEVPATTRRG